MRLEQARAFLQAAELVAENSDDLATDGVAASLVVLSGIAAADAACCAVLGRRSRGQNHREAASLLSQVEPDGKTLARTLDRLLDVKDAAQYGMDYVSRQEARAAMRQAKVLVDASASLLRRG